MLRRTAAKTSIGMLVLTGIFGAGTACAQEKRTLPRELRL